MTYAEFAEKSMAQPATEMLMELARIAFESPGTFESPIEPCGDLERRLRALNSGQEVWVFGENVTQEYRAIVEAASQEREDGQRR